MTDADIRAAALKHLYDVRDAGGVDELSPADMGVDVPQHTLSRILFHLKEHGLVKGFDARDGDGLCLLDPRISAHGVDVVEGNETSPIAINLDQSTVYHVGSVTAQGVQFGTGNKQEVRFRFEQLASAIEGSTMPDEDKRSLRARVTDFLRHPAAHFVVPTAGDALQLFL